MALFYALVVLSFICALAAFFAFSPKGNATRVPRRVNRCAAAAIVLIWVGCILYFRWSMAEGCDSGWWPVLAVTSASVLSVPLLAIAFVLRNVVLCPKPGSTQ